MALGSEEAAKKSIYSVSTKYYYAFSCKVPENLTHKIKSLSGVKWILPDSYLYPDEDGYGAKQARLKQAKEEAEKEIAEFRAQMEAEFRRKVAESSGDSGANVKRLEQETEAKIHHLNTEASRISHDVVQMLLRHVKTVKN